MNRHVALRAVFVLAFLTQAARSQQRQSVPVANSLASPKQIDLHHPIEKIVLRANENQVEPSSVKRWRGDENAYRALLGMLSRDPENAQVWRNALKALSVVGSDAKHAQNVSRELQAFAFDDGRFNDHSHSAFGTTSEPMKFADAAFFAKRAVPEACGILVRFAPSGSVVAANAIAFLKDGADPKFWDNSKFRWSSEDDYSTPSDRSTDMAILSVRALRDEACTSAARAALDEITKWIHIQKDPISGKWDQALVPIRDEVIASSLGCN